MPDIIAVEFDPLLFRLYWDRKRLSVRRLRTEGATHRATLLYLFLTRGRPPLGWPGDVDMLAAVREALSLGIEVALVDRPVAVTMNRLAEELLSFPTIAKSIRQVRHPATRHEYLDNIDAFVDTLIALGINSDPEQLDLIRWFDSLSEDDVVKLNAAFEHAFPLYSRVMIQERDRYIAGKLQWLREEGRDVVAFLGRSHVAGVDAYLENPEAIPVDAVTAPPFVSSTASGETEGSPHR